MPGPAHAQARQRNDDAWLAVRRAGATAVVVCDGLGSRPHGGHGARMACLAARDALGAWSRGSCLRPELLARLIDAHWRVRVQPHSPDHCATTCLIAVRVPGRGWVVGGVGDGLALVATAEREPHVVVGTGRTGFANETCAMGGRFREEDWKFATAPDVSGQAAILATDGVSDDLRAERLPGFTDWLLTSFGGPDARRAGRRLAGELRAWPTPGHSDDKTIAVLLTRPIKKGKRR